jgi:hypothetical protein
MIRQLHDSPSQPMSPAPAARADIKSGLKLRLGMELG